jgi:hypothetical protein
MFDIKQFVTQDACSKCEGCCRFTEENSIWQPILLDEEIKIISKESTDKDTLSLSKKINSLPFKDYFICSFFDIDNKKCKIYNIRPFECRLYPFLINKTKDATYLSVDLKCPFIKDKLESKDFKDYGNYLMSFLCLPVISFTIKHNPQILSDYTQGSALQNLSTLIF